MTCMQVSWSKNILYKRFRSSIRSSALSSDGRDCHDTIFDTSRTVGGWREAWGRGSSKPLFGRHRWGEQRHIREGRHGGRPETRCGGAEQVSGYLREPYDWRIMCLCSPPIGHRGAVQFTPNCWTPTTFKDTVLCHPFIGISLLLASIGYSYES